jgi:hypothetical protein
VVGSATAVVVSVVACGGDSVVVSVVVAVSVVAAPVVVSPGSVVVSPVSVVFAVVVAFSAGDGSATVVVAFSGSEPLGPASAGGPAPTSPLRNTKPRPPTKSRRPAPTSRICSLSTPSLPALDNEPSPLMDAQSGVSAREIRRSGFPRRRLSTRCGSDSNLVSRARAADQRQWMRRPSLHPLYSLPRLVIHRLTAAPRSECPRSDSVLRERFARTAAPRPEDRRDRASRVEYPGSGPKHLFYW